MPVVDTNVILRTRGGIEDAVTAESAMDEVISESGERRLEGLEIRTRRPSSESLEQVRAVSDEIESPTSEVDEEVVAVAVDMNEKVVSDDRAVQNLAAHLGLEFDGFMDDRIDERRSWKRVCSNCGMEAEAGECSRCGADTVRKTDVRSPV